jgi:hypothetical protein
MSCFHTYSSSAKASFKLSKDYFTVRKNSSILSDQIIARLRAIDPLLIGDAKDGRQRISLGLIGPSSLSSRSGIPASATSIPITYITIHTNYESIATFDSYKTWLCGLWRSSIQNFVNCFNSSTVFFTSSIVGLRILTGNVRHQSPRFQMIILLYKKV